MTGTMFGTKAGAGVYQTIIAQFPPHDTYIETHVGSGAIFLRKPPAAANFAIDRDWNSFLSITDVRRAYGPDAQIVLVPGRCEEFLAEFDFAGAGRPFVYADPPYIHSARTSRMRYLFEYSDEEHAQLLHILKALPAAVAISGYHSELYDRELADWRKIEFQAMTRGGVRTECLWLNYPEGPMHWHTYAGRDRTRRQMIKRKAQRWRQKFDKLSEGERLAILAELMDAGSCSHS